MAITTLIIINKRAGSLSAETIEKSLLEALAFYPPKMQAQVKMLVTGDIDFVRDQIQAYQASLDRVIAAGGDGTVIEVISAILPFPHLKLGIIPVGTGNRLASNLGIPSTVKGALNTALKGTPRAIDIGRINNRYFALMAGTGVDAEIMAGIRPAEKRTFGILAYFWQGVQQAFRTPYAIFDIEIDGKLIRCRGIGVIIANAGNLLGRYFTLTPGAQPDDGLLDVCVLASRRRTDYWTSMIHILSQQTSEDDKNTIRQFRGKRISIRSKPPMLAQADGDLIGTTPLEIEALPNAVSVLIPQTTEVRHPVWDMLHHIRDHWQLVLRDILRI